MWFGLKDESNWYPLNIQRVNEILELNRAGKKPATLEVNVVPEKDTAAPLNNDLERLDKKYKNKKRKKPRNRGNQRGPRPSNNKQP
jgi:hypothetical protein